MNALAALVNRVLLGIVVLLPLLPGTTTAQTPKEGLYALEKEQYDLARRIFQTLLTGEATPTHHFYMGYFHLATQQPDSARPHFEAGLARDSRSALNLVGLGEVEIARGNLSGAREPFEQAKKLTRSKDAAVFYHIGLAYMRHEVRDLEAAIAALEEAIALAGEQGAYYVALGRAYEQHGDAGAASLNYDRASFYEPGLPAPHVYAGDLYVRARNYSEALKQYQAGLTADSSYAPAHRALAELYFLAKQYDRAVEHYRRYLDLTPATPEKGFTYAGYLYLNKQYHESLEVLRPLDGTYANPIVHRLLAYNYFESKQYDLGLEQMQVFFEKAGAADRLPSDYEYYGRLQIAAADTLAGIDNLRNAMAADTSRWTLHRDIATVYLSGKRYAEAAREYESMATGGRKLNGTDLLNLGKAYYFDEHYAQADAAFARVNEAASNSSLGWLWRGRASARMDSTGAEGRARPFYETYIALTTDTTRYQRELIEAHYYLAYLYYVQNDKARLEMHVNAVLGLDPEHEQARALLAAAQQL